MRKDIRVAAGDFFEDWLIETLQSASPIIMSSPLQQWGENCPPSEG